MAMKKKRGTKRAGKKSARRGPAIRKRAGAKTSAKRSAAKRRGPAVKRSSAKKGGAKRSTAKKSSGGGRKRSTGLGARVKRVATGVAEQAQNAAVSGFEAVKDLGENIVD